MVGNNAFGMSFIFKQCMKNAQNYGKEYMLLFFLVTICPSSSMWQGSVCVRKKTPTGIHGSVIWKLFCHDVSLNAIVQNVS